MGFFLDAIAAFEGKVREEATPYGFPRESCMLSASRACKRTDIPSLSEDYSKEEKEKENTGSDPAVGGVWSRGIQVGLVLL